MQSILDEIDAKRSATAALCERFGVRSLALFGSATGPDWNADTSDLDFLVEFELAAEGSIADRYLHLAEALESLFGRPVDLITSAAIRNPYFRRSVELSRTVVYAA